MSKYGSTLSTTLCPHSRQFPSYVDLVHRVRAALYSLCLLQGLIKPRFADVCTLKQIFVVLWFPLENFFRHLTNQNF